MPLSFSKNTLNFPLGWSVIQGMNNKRNLASVTLLTLGLLAALPFTRTANAQTMSGVPDAPENVKPLGVGARVPKVMVKSLEGKNINLPKFLSAQPTVLIFYRGGWCPFCNQQMAGLQKIEGDLKNLGYRLVAISPDRAEELRKSIDKNHLSYKLLSDSPMKAAQAFGVAFHLDDSTIEKYKGYGVDLERSSGEKHHYLPVPSVFLIGRDGIIKYEYHNADYKVRLSGEDLLAAARKNR
jgi:peroxiredoxin